MLRPDVSFRRLGSSSLARLASARLALARLASARLASARLASARLGTVGLALAATLVVVTGISFTVLACCGDPAARAKRVALPVSATSEQPPHSGQGGGSSASPEALPFGPIPTFPPAPRPRQITLPDVPAAAWISRVPTDQPVAFITIDDGWIRRPEAAQLLAAARVPVTLFLTINAIRADTGYFRRLQAEGAVIEAHTITHVDLAGKSYETQRREVCGSADQLGAWYGRRPVLFRPPFGDKDARTLQAAHDCGVRAVFFWKETVNDGVVRYQEPGGVKPGDIILMHFRATFVADFLAALRAIHDAGLTPALLEDYIPGGDGRRPPGGRQPPYRFAAGVPGAPPLPGAAGRRL